MDLDTDYYGILGVSKESTEDEIVDRYVIVSLDILDKSGESLDGLKVAIDKAYAVLSDPVKREAYDKELEDQSLAEALHFTGEGSGQKSAALHFTGEGSGQQPAALPFIGEGSGQQPAALPKAKSKPEPKGKEKEIWDLNRDYYGVMGLSEQSTQDDINAKIAAIRQTYEEFERDFGEPLDDEILKVIEDAYAFLSDPQKKEAYDKKILEEKKKLQQLQDESGKGESGQQSAPEGESGKQSAPSIKETKTKEGQQSPLSIEETKEEGIEETKEEGIEETKEEGKKHKPAAKEKHKPATKKKKKKKAQKEGNKTCDWNHSDEITRLHSLLSGFPAATLSYLSDSFHNMNQTYLEFGEYGSNTVKLKSLNDSLESLTDSIKKNSKEIELMNTAFSSAEEPELASVLCGDLRIITYRLQKIEKLSCTLHYQRGTLFFEDNRFGYRCFVRTRTSEEAGKPFDLSRPVSDDARGVCKPDLYLRHKGDPLLAFPTFCKVSDDTYFQRSLTSPRTPHTIFQYPNKVTRDAIKSILGGVNHLTKVRRMHSKLHDVDSYVLTKWKMTTTEGKTVEIRDVKIIGVDKVLEGPITESDIERMKQGILKLCLTEGKPNEGWDYEGGYRKTYGEEWTFKDNFLTSFHCKHVSLEVRLDMLATCPFLKETYWEVVKFFADLYLVVLSKVLFLNRGVWGLRYSLNTNDLVDKYMSKEDGYKWTRKKNEVVDKKYWGPEFQAVFDYEFSQQSKGPCGEYDTLVGVLGEAKEGNDPYDEQNLWDLIKFLRHVVVHHCSDGHKGGMQPKHVFEVINRCWPGLIEEMHEVVFYNENAWVQPKKGAGKGGNA